MPRDRQLRRDTNIYKYIKNSFRAGRDQLFAVVWDINSDEGEKICGINGKKVKIALGRAMGYPLWMLQASGGKDYLLWGDRALLGAPGGHHHEWLGGQK